MWNTQKIRPFFFFNLGHYNHDEGDFSHVSGSLYLIFLTKWDPLLVADMNLKLVPNTNYCSTDGFPQDIIACSRHVGGICNPSV